MLYLQFATAQSVRSNRAFRSAADLPRVTFHALRHTCGSLLHQEGVPARAIMEFLGHSQITLTLGTYCHATPVMFDEAAGALERALGGSR